MRTRERFGAYVDSSSTDDGELFDLLADDAVAAPNTLPDTGIDRDLERLLSAPFVISPHYGTRSSTVVRWANNDTIDWVERSFTAAGTISDERRFSFALERE